MLGEASMAGRRERAFGAFQGFVVGRVVKPSPKHARDWTLEDEAAIIELAWPGPRGDRVVLAVRGISSSEVRFIEFDRVLLEPPAQT